MPDQYSMKLEDFLRHFEGFPGSTEIIFGSGDLKFLQVRKRSDGVLQIEFEKPQGPRVSYATFSKG